MSTLMEDYSVVIIGAGPAGLTAAYDLTKKRLKPLVLEKGDKVGGISRTETYKGYRFDIGGHRFYTKVGEVNHLWHEVLEKDLLKVPRLSRIYYKGKFFDYPLTFLNTLLNLGLITSALVLLSYLKAKFSAFIRRPEPETFEEWVTHCFGRRLYKIFFETYTEKVWGIPCNQIQAEWAKQRIKGLSLRSAIINLFFSSNKPKTLIEEFEYPALGPGMMWESFQDKIIEAEGKVLLNSTVLRIETENNSIKSIVVNQDGEIFKVSGNHFISTMPITELIRCIDPPPPEAVIQASKSLSYRAFLIVALIIDSPNLFPDNWIYIHTREVRVGRIQNFKNWSLAMVPDPSKTCLGMEYFCNENDEIWNMSNSDLVELAIKELAFLKLADIRLVEDSAVVRQPKAYPIYDQNYQQHLSVLKNYLGQLNNLQTIGRNGMHRYNNQDHSMLTGLLAARNVVGEDHDLWQVNTERSYYEEFTKQEWRQFSSRASSTVTRNLE